MRIDVVSLFPEFIAQCAAFGVVGRARERGLLALHGWNPRDYATGNYRRVDDRPFGGGPGMVMLIDPLRAAIVAARAADPTPAKVIYLTPQGARLGQARVRELATRARVILLCGRYEGIDERLIAAEVRQLALQLFGFEILQQRVDRWLVHGMACWCAGSLLGAGLLLRECTWTRVMAWVERSRAL